MATKTSVHKRIGSQARRMIHDGLSVEKAASYLGASVEDIEAGIKFAEINEGFSVESYSDDKWLVSFSEIGGFTVSKSEYPLNQVLRDDISNELYQDGGDAEAVYQMNRRFEKRGLFARKR